MRADTDADYCSSSTSSQVSHGPLRSSVNQAVLVVTNVREIIDLVTLDLDTESFSLV